METRKVQTIRDSTHLISLPKAWVDQLGIHGGTPLTMRLLPDGSILLTPPNDRPKPNLAHDLTLDSVNADDVIRSIIGAYVAGYESIRVRPQRGTIDQIEAAVRRACERVHGLVVVETGPGFLVLQDLLDPREFNATKGLRRMHAEARNMLVAARRHLAEEPGALTVEAFERMDDELDRLLLILIKQHNLQMRDLSLSEKVGIPLEETLNYLLVAQYLERVGDYAVRLVRSHQVPSHLKATPQISHLLGALDLAVKAVDDAMSAFHRRDVSLANETVRLAHNLGHLARTTPLQVVASRERPTILPTCQACLGYAHAFECLERVGLYAKSIAEVAVNQALARAPDRPQVKDPR